MAHGRDILIVAWLFGTHVMRVRACARNMSRDPGCNDHKHETRVECVVGGGRPWPQPQPQPWFHAAGEGAARRSALSH